MRSRAPPVADAARRSTRSGRKERASEQREVLFGYRKAEGANTPWLPLERICAQYGFGFFAPEKSKFVSSTASDRKGFVKGESVPLDRILVPFVRTKGTPRRRAVQIMPLQKPAPTISNHKNPARSFLAPGGKLDACFNVLGYPFSSTASRCPTPAHKYPPCAGCSGHFPGRSHRTGLHPPPPRRR